MSFTTFTVFFDSPFWVGVLEIVDEEGVRAARHVFGAEPTGAELYAFGLSRDYDRLVRQAHAGPPAQPSARPPTPGNPKTAARRAARKQHMVATSTAAQAALKAALAESKIARCQQSRAEREADASRRRDLARTKAKARHRGR